MAPEETAKRVDPSQFVVRRKSYAQVEGYPEACAAVTEFLLKKSPQDIGQAYNAVQKAMRFSRALNRDAVFGVSSSSKFGIPRKAAEEPHRYTSLSGVYVNDEIRVREQLGNYGSEHLHMRGDRGNGYDDTIELSSLQMTDGSGVIWHPKVEVGEEGEYMDQRRWAWIASFFKSAMDESLPPQEREEVSVKCYALLSHDCPFKRGSATFARIVLEYLSHKADFKIPPLKEEVDLNTMALTMTVEAFLEGWKKRDYFAPEMNASDIMEWHKTRAKPVEQGKGY